MAANRHDLTLGVFWPTASSHVWSQNGPGLQPFRQSWSNCAIFFISHWLCFDLDLLSTEVSNCCRIVLRPQKPICWLSDVFEWMINRCEWMINQCLISLVACLVWTGLQLNKVFATRATLLSWFLISCHGIYRFHCRGMTKHLTNMGDYLSLATPIYYIYIYIQKSMDVNGKQ